MKRILLLTAFLLALPGTGSAQQQPPQPGIIVVSYQKCHIATLDELNAYFRRHSAPILNALVREGRLLGWGVLEHAWGDEWNNVVYYLARDLQTFHAAFNEYFGRLMQSDPNVMQAFGGFCSEHKDNIYSVVMTESTPAQ